jgi:hypothetical protein
MIAGDMNKYDTVEGLTDREKEVLDREIAHKWSQPGYAICRGCVGSFARRRNMMLPEAMMAHKISI